MMFCFTCLFFPVSELKKQPFQANILPSTHIVSTEARKVYISLKELLATWRRGDSQFLTGMEEKTLE